MTNTARMSGRTSKFGYGKQSAQGSLASFTDVINTASFDCMDAANVEIYTTLNGNLDSQSEAREGIHDVSAKLSAPVRGIQGIGLIKAGVGTDTLSGTQKVLGAPTSAITAGDQTIACTALGALPAGVNDYAGLWVTLTNGVTETVPISKGAPGDTSFFVAWPVKNSYATSGTTMNIAANQHIIQPNTGANIALLDWVSLVGQYAAVLERQVLDAQVESLTIKGEAKAGLTMDLAFAVSAMFPYEGALTTTLTYATGEASDTPYKLQDGVLATFGAASDTYMKPHTRLTTFQYDLKYADQKVQEGGTPNAAQVVTQNVVGPRTQALTFSETAGDGNFATFRADFVQTRRETPAMLAYRNGTNKLSIYMPRCAVNAYDPAGPTDAPISYSGSLTPLLDAANSGLAVRVVVASAVVAQY